MKSYRDNPITLLFFDLLNKEYIEMERLPNIDKVSCEDSYYPFIIGSLLAIFQHTTNIKNSGMKIQGMDKSKYEKFIHRTYSADQYRLENHWFEKGETSVEVLIDHKQNKIEKIFITSEHIDTVYEVPSLFWELFDESSNIRFITKSIRYCVKKLYDPSPIEKLDESDKIKFDLIELIYKRLSGSFETHLEFEINLDDFGFFHVIPVFYFNTLLTEEYVSDKLVRTKSIVEFFDKYYQMEDTIRSINKLMEERNGR